MPIHFLLGLTLAALCAVPFGTGCATTGEKPWMPGWSPGPAEKERSLRRQVTTYLADELSPDVDPSVQKLIYTSNRGGTGTSGCVL